jgi:predicted RNA binding protein YcfA (HicA-like mRNA interferase family)
LDELEQASSNIRCEVIKILGKIGFAIVGRKGSYVRMKRQRGKEVLIVIVPMHPELARGTLRSILRQANLTMDDLQRLL